MRVFYHMLVLMLLAVLVFRVLAMQVVIDSAEEKAEKAMIIVALIYDAEMPYEEPFIPDVKRYKAPQTFGEHPWMLEDPLPEEFPPLTDI